MWACPKKVVHPGKEKVQQKELRMATEEKGEVKRK